MSVIALEGRAAWAVNEVIRMSPWGSSRVIAEFGPAAPGVFGLLGLTCDWWGNVYVAFASGNENHGVWKIHRDGRKEHLRGSENIVMPNALTFDWREIFMPRTVTRQPWRDGVGLALQQAFSEL